MCLSKEQKNKLKEWIANKTAKGALKLAHKAFAKLIESGKTLDLNANDVNDLLEWNLWIEKALKNF